MLRISVFGLIMHLALLTMPASADQGQWYLAPGAQWMEFDEETTPYDEAWGPFIGLGYDISERLSFEISTFDLDPDVNSGGEIDLDHYKFDVLYDLGIGRVRPFIVGGLGNTNFGGENDTLIDLGAGLKVDISDNLVWRTTLRSFNYLGRDHEDRDLGVESSLVFYFGGPSRSTPTAAAPAREPVREPQPEPEPAAPVTPAIQDSDRDGVADGRDECPETPMDYAVDEVGCPIPVEEVARFELLVNFDFDQTEVEPRYFPEIEELAEFLEQYPDVIAELEGHTDSMGSEAYNQDLSERRVNAVREVLIERFDIDASRVTTTGYGESQPVASNDTEAGRAENRRVITVVLRTLQRYQPR